MAAAAGRGAYSARNYNFSSRGNRRHDRDIADGHEASKEWYRCISCCPHKKSWMDPALYWWTCCACLPFLAVIKFALVVGFVEIIYLFMFFDSLVRIPYEMFARLRIVVLNQWMSGPLKALIFPWIFIFSLIYPFVVVLPGAVFAALGMSLYSVHLYTFGTDNVMFGGMIPTLRDAVDDVVLVHTYHQNILAEYYTRYVTRPRNGGPYTIKAFLGIKYWWEPIVYFFELIIFLPIGVLCIVPACLGISLYKIPPAVMNGWYLIGKSMSTAMECCDRRAGIAPCCTFLTYFVPCFIAAVVWPVLAILSLLGYFLVALFRSLIVGYYCSDTRGHPTGGFRYIGKVIEMHHCYTNELCSGHFTSYRPMFINEDCHCCPIPGYCLCACECLDPADGIVDGAQLRKKQGREPGATRESSRPPARNAVAPVPAVPTTAGGLMNLASRTLRGEPAPSQPQPGQQQGAQQQSGSGSSSRFSRETAEVAGELVGAMAGALAKGLTKKAMGQPAFGKAEPSYAPAKQQPVPQKAGPVERSQPNPPRGNAAPAELRRPGARSEEGYSSASSDDEHHGRHHGNHHNNGGGPSGVPPPTYQQAVYR